MTFVGPGSRAEAQRNYCGTKAVVLVLTNLEPEREEWRERLTWVEGRLRARGRASTLRSAYLRRWSNCG
jgi:hypothetical protein